MTVSEIQTIIKSLSISCKSFSEGANPTEDAFTSRADLWESLLSSFRSSVGVPPECVPQLVQAWIHEFNPGSADGKWTSAKLEHARLKVLTKALIALTRTLYDKSLLGLFKESIPLLLNIVLKIIEDPIPDTSLLSLALMGIKLHQLPDEFLPLVGERILLILGAFMKSTSTTNTTQESQSTIQYASVHDEALSALERHLKWADECLTRPDLWFFPVLTLLFSEDVSARKHADAFLKLHSHLFWNKYPFERSSIQDFVDFLATKTNDPCNMLISWGHVIMYCGQKVHRNPLLNLMLSYVEVNFNSTRPGHRIFAFNAWRRLILSFSLNDHLFNAKRLKLIMLPMWNCFKFEKSYAVRQTCFDSYLYLTYHLSKRPAIKDILLQVILPALAIQNNEQQLLVALMSCVASLISETSRESEPLALLSNPDLDLLDARPNETLPHIKCVIARDNWTLTDVDVLLKVMERSMAVFKDVDAQGPVQIIWSELCSYAQGAWEKGYGDTAKKLVQFSRKHVEPEYLHVLLPNVLFHIPPMLEEEDRHICMAILNDISAMSALLARGTQTHRAVIDWISKAKSMQSPTKDARIDIDMSLQQPVAVNPSHHLEVSLARVQQEEKELAEKGQDQVTSGPSPRSRPIGKFYRQNTTTQYVAIPDRKKDAPATEILTERQVEKREMSVEPIALKMYSSYLNSSEADALAQVPTEALDFTTGPLSNSPEPIAKDTKSSVQRGLKRPRTDDDAPGSDIDVTTMDQEMEALFEWKPDALSFGSVSPVRDTTIGTETPISPRDMAISSIESLKHALETKSLSMGDLIHLQKELAQVMVELSSSLHTATSSTESSIKR